MLDQIWSDKKGATPKPSGSGATIKGMFVNSHVEALRRKLGDEGVAELKRRLGKPVHYKSLEPVPITDEVILIETTLDLLNGNALEGKLRTAAAGRLHFTNFAGTTLGSTLMHSLPHTVGGFKTLLHNIPSVAKIVFSGIHFQIENDTNVTVLVRNCDYPLEHFCGFFEEWLQFWGLESARVHAEATALNTFRYQLIF